LGTVKRVFRDAIADSITGEAAKAAYYLFLSFFPLILVVFALTGMLGGDRAFQWIMGQLERSMPGEGASVLEQYVRQVTDQRRPGLLSVGLLLTLWSASSFFTALGDGLDAMLDVEKKSSWWKKRLKAILLLILGGVLLVGGVVVILAGPALIQAAGLGRVAVLLRWPLALLLLVSLIWLVYLIMPSRSQRHYKGETFIGALVGALLWLAATAGFRFYIANFGRYSETYGAVGVVIVLLLWLYITALAVLFGGEVADALEEREERKGRGDIRIRPAA